MKRALLIFLAALLVGGCAGVRQPELAPAAAPVAQEAAPRASQPAPAVTAPAPQAPAPTVAKPVDREAAVKAVGQDKEVAEFAKQAQAAGRRVIIQVEGETPTRFHLRVAEDDGMRRVTIYWYLVNKADGKVTKWDMANGPLPED